jgi:hypothetical protein
MQAEFLKIRILSLLLIAMLPGISTAAETYLTQSYVDSIVDRAYYHLNSAADPSSGTNLERAIENAREITASLKKKAKGDINEKYILWKVNELEGQIYLEQKGVLQEKNTWKQKTANELIAAFNTELGRRRPSFSALESLQGRMEATDPDKALQLQHSIRKRRQAIVQELRVTFDDALAGGMIDKAREDLSYLQLNHKHLGISVDEYARISAKIQSRTSIEEELKIITAALEAAGKMLQKRDLSNARKECSIARSRLDECRTRMLRLEWERLTTEWGRMHSRLQLKEDSLIGIAMNLMNSSGPSASENYLDTLRYFGVSQEKIGRLDRILLEKAIAQSRNESNLQSKKLIAMVEIEDTSETVSALDQLLLAAKQKAKAKKDSLEALSDQNARLTQVAEVRRDRLSVTQQQRSQREQDRREELAKQARTELVTVYLLLEKNKAKEAQRQFDKSRSLFKEALAADEYAKIDSTVNNAIQNSK